MYKIKNLWIVAILALAISSCRKDTIDFIEGPKGQNFTSNILGSVIDEAGQPVANATVKYLGITKTSDENGVYYFKNVEVNSKHSLITIRKEGYFEGSRVFSTDRSNTVRVRNTLLAKTFDQSFESTAGSTLKKGAITLEFPADGVVLASNNSSYSGTVQVAMKYLNPDGVEIFDQMPGTLAGINSANQIAAMTTYGMVAVELQTPSGQQLQIAPGKKVKMSNKLSSSTLSKAPSTIPLWYYDENLGYWKEEGEAKLINDTYVGEVAHFTYWNYDAQAPAIILSGRVVDQFGNPVANAHVWISDPLSGGSGHGNTNTDGLFSGFVTQNALLNISVTVYVPGCNFTEIYSGQIGPFSNDATIPDLVSNLASVDHIIITGNAINCSGSNVTEGYVKATFGQTNEFIAINNGVFNSAIIYCGNQSEIKIKAIDTESGMESTNLTYPVSSNIDLGTLNVCANVADFIEIKIPDIGLDTVLFNELWSENSNYKEIHHGYGIDSGNVYLNIYWLESNINTISTGTYNIVPNETNFSQIPGFYVIGEEGTVTINQGGSQPGDVIIGSYSFKGNSAGTVNQRTVFGSFKMTLE